MATKPSVTRGAARDLADVIKQRFEEVVGATLALTTSGPAEAPPGASKEPDERATERLIEHIRTELVRVPAPWRRWVFDYLGEAISFCGAVATWERPNGSAQHTAPYRRHLRLVFTSAPPKKPRLPLKTISDTADEIDETERLTRELWSLAHKLASDLDRHCPALSARGWEMNAKARDVHKKIEAIETDFATALSRAGLVPPAAD